MKKTKWLALLFVAVASLASSGCALLLVGTGAAIGAGTVAYLGGELQATEDAPLDKARQAAEAALSDMKLPITKTVTEAGATTLVARGADDTRIEIKLTVVSPTVTRVGIRIGAFGDEALSLHILEKIEKRL